MLVLLLFLILEEKEALWIKFFKLSLKLWPIINLFWKLHLWNSELWITLSQLYSWKMKTPITVLDGEVFRRNAMYLAISGAGNQHGKFNSFTPYYIACLAGFTTSFVTLFLRKKQKAPTKTVYYFQFQQMRTSNVYREKYFHKKWDLVK